MCVIRCWVICTIAAFIFGCYVGYTAQGYLCLYALRQLREAADEKIASGPVRRRKPRLRERWEN